MCLCEDEQQSVSKGERDKCKKHIKGNILCACERERVSVCVSVCVCV